MVPEFKTGLYWSHEKSAPGDLVAKVVIQVMNRRKYIKGMGDEWVQRGAELERPQSGKGTR